MLKHLQSWNDSKTHVSIQFSNSEELIIYPKYPNNTYVYYQQEIASYSFQNIMRDPIRASESGYLSWTKQNNPIVLSPSKIYQTFAFIVKKKNQSELLIDDQTHIFNEQPSQASLQNQSTTTLEENKIEYFRFSHLAWGYMHYGKIIKWNVKNGDFVQPSQIIGIYQDDQNDIRELVISMEGQIMSLALVKQFYSYNDVILSIMLVKQNCKHIRIELGICIFCRKKIDLSNQIKDQNCFPEWNFEEEQLKRYSLDIIKDIVENKRKLILVLDLDQTILHSIRIQKEYDTIQLIKNERSKMQIELGDNYDLDQMTNNNEQISYYIQETFFEIECDEQSKYLVNLRPYIEQFFQILIPYYEIFIYTKACRNYADEIIRQLRLVNSSLNFPQIITRDETDDIDSKSLNRLFADGVADNLIIILDDNQQIWKGFQDKIVYTKPFTYFKEQQEIVQIPQIEDDNDHFLLAIAKKLQDSSHYFWNSVLQAQQDPGYFMESSKKMNKKNKKEFEKKQQSIRMQILNTSDTYQLIIQRNITISQVYRDLKKKTLSGIQLHFAISQKNDITKYMESVIKKKALELGATIKSKFENFNGLIITHSLLNIKSVKQYQKDSKPIIHYQWILDCETYLQKLDYTIYDLNKNSPENIENGKEVSKKLKVMYFNKL